MSASTNVDPRQLIGGQDQLQALEPPVRGHDRDRDALADEVPDDPRADAPGAAGDEEPLVGHGLLQLGCRWPGTVAGQATFV